jgi:hypothetical protein
MKTRATLLSTEGTRAEPAIRNRIRRSEFQHGHQRLLGSHHAARLLEGLFAPVARHLSDRAFPATSQAEKTHFHQINKQTGHQLRQQMVDEETGRVVDTGHKGRGYELTKGKYVEIDEDELKAIQVESTRTVDIEVRAAGRHRQALFGQAILHCAEREDRSGSLHRHPRRHTGRRTGRAGAHRHGSQGARDHAGASRQRPAGHDAAL